MPKKYNNNSNKFSDWTTKKLKEYASSLHDLIYGEMPCYGSSDLRMYDGVCNELHERGISINTSLSFN